MYTQLRAADVHVHKQYFIHSTDVQSITCIDNASACCDSMHSAVFTQSPQSAMMDALDAIRMAAMRMPAPSDYCVQSAFSSYPASCPAPRLQP